MARIDKTKYIKSHGVNPKGYGKWAFQIVSARNNQKVVRTHFIMDNFAKACRAAQDIYKNRKAVGAIEVLG